MMLLQQTQMEAKLSVFLRDNQSLGNVTAEYLSGKTLERTCNSLRTNRSLQFTCKHCPCGGYIELHLLKKVWMQDIALYLFPDLCSLRLIISDGVIGTSLPEDAG